MFRTYIINQLTQLSTWLGAIIILFAIFTPPTWIVVLGIVVLITDDTRLRNFFMTMKKSLEESWPVTKN